MRPDEVLLHRNLLQLRIFRGRHRRHPQDSDPIGLAHTHATRCREAHSIEGSPLAQNVSGLRVRPGEGTGSKTGS
jgi:hypothetical protein